MRAQSLRGERYGAPASREREPYRSRRKPPYNRGMPRVTVSARRKLDGPLAQPYAYPPIRLRLLLPAIAIAVGTVVTLIWLGVGRS